MLYINITDLQTGEWDFIQPLCSDPDLDWAFEYGGARHWLERNLRRPALGRYRAAITGVWRAARRKDAVLVSHLPTVTLVVAVLMRLFGIRRPHIAFAFNYTDLPRGAKLGLSRWAFRGVTEFVVFSRDEIASYSRLFGLPPERFVFLPWAMDAPAADTASPVEGRYFCAIGGEGRDYGLLAAAMRDLPGARMVIVARPHSTSGIDFPDNVTVLHNLPPDRTWAIAKGAMGMAIPLRGARTANGHITITAAQLLGIPLIVTRSSGVADYVDDETAQMVGAGDAGAITAALAALDHDPQEAIRRADNARIKARTQADLHRWVDYFVALNARLKAA